MKRIRSFFSSGKDSKEDQSADEDRLIFSGLIIALVIVVVFAGYSVWKSQQPSPFTQVWLVEESLPQTFTSGVPFSFSFVVDNHELGSVDYDYSVSVNGANKIRGSESVDLGDPRILNVTMALSGNSSEAQRVLVTITKPGVDSVDYTLWFWVNPV